MTLVISDGWDVANHHIHEAFRLIGEACMINLHTTSKYEQIVESIDWISCQSLASSIRYQSIIENKLAIISIILFQAGMEAWISWAYTRNELSSCSKPRKFVHKWEMAFSELGSSFDFSNYARFYRDYRNPVVHPSNANDVLTVSQIYSKPVIVGISYGWEAISELSTELGMAFDPNSWDTICRINGVPQKDEVKKLGDLQKFERELLKKHLDGANSV